MWCKKLMSLAKQHRIDGSWLKSAAMEEDSGNSRIRILTSIICTKLTDTYLESEVQMKKNKFLKGILSSSLIP